MGYAVAIAGAGFSRRSATLGYVRARFNTSMVPGVWRSASELRVVAPEHAADAAPGRERVDAVHLHEPGGRTDTPVHAKYRRF